ncbi:MAG: nitronate monooxygenase, partial [Candidatus Aminicenantes bacterium]|nr:nitronate monooxygenase [Candidatus Aminicenantes bacterium]
MTIPKLKIGSITAEIPIVQGGMGVRVSLSSLASAVTNAGGIGTLSSIGLGDFVDSLSEYEKISHEALEREIHQVKKMTAGPVAVNFMGALSNVNDLIKTAVSGGIKIIVFGAGLPTALPELVPDPSVNLVPIVSSARVAELILRVWDKRYGRT